MNREADRLAEQVVQPGPAPRRGHRPAAQVTRAVQRQTRPESEPAAPTRAARQLEAQLAAQAGSGQALSAAVRSQMEAGFGAEVLPADERLLAAVLEHTNGEGAPVVIEATGNVKAAEQTVELVAAGGPIVVVGLFRQGVELGLPGLDITRKEMSILGSRASVNCFPESLALLASGAIRYPHVATALNLWDAPQIFEPLAHDPGALHKGVLMT